eukprot:1685741-Amphidinium_carterae.2
MHEAACGEAIAVHFPGVPPPIRRGGGRVNDVALCLVVPCAVEVPTFIVQSRFDTANVRLRDTEALAALGRGHSLYNGGALFRISWVLIRASGIERRLREAMADDTLQ